MITVLKDKEWLDIVILVIAFYLQIICLDYVRKIDTPTVIPASASLEPMNPDIFKILTFGQMPMAIDWLFMSVLQDTPLPSLRAKTRPPFFYTLDLITTLDAAFFEAYYVGSSLLTVARKDPEGSQIILKKADTFIQNTLPNMPKEFQERFWPYPWQLYIFLGYVEMLELGNLARASEVFNKIKAFKTAPEYLMSLANRFKDLDALYALAFRVIGFMLQKEFDSERKRLLLQQEEYLKVSAFIAFLNRDFLNFKKQYPRLSHQKLSEKFFRSHSKKDPWGGNIVLDPLTGRLLTSTYYGDVLSLDALELLKAH